MKLSTATLIVLCSAPLAGAQITDTPKGLTPVGPTIGITGVQATLAHAPEAITIQGEGLNMVTHVRINGIHVPILRKAPAFMVVDPLPGDPGFPSLELLSAVGNVETIVEYLPTLSVHTAQDRLRAILHAGGPGQYWIYFGINRRKEPAPFAGIHYGSMLILSSNPSGLLATGFSDGYPHEIDLNIPPLAPYPIYFQGVCMYGQKPNQFGSFTNLWTQVWEPKLTSPASLEGETVW